MNLVILLLTLCTIAAAAEEPCSSVGMNEEEVTFADYTVRTTRSDGGSGCLEVRKSGVIVHTERDAMKYHVGNNRYGENLEGFPPIPEIKIGADITGNGIPNAIVSAWTGGAHCCFSFIVLELGKTFKVAARINAGHSDLAHFEDVNHKGKYVFIGNDWAFAYWHTSFLQSPAPIVILRPERYDSGQISYKLALDLMKKPAPTDKEFKLAVQNIRSDEAWKDSVPPQLWAKMINFIYTSNPQFAWKLLNQGWPKKKPGKSGFLGAFCDRLETSDYSYDISDLMKDAPPDCF